MLNHEMEKIRKIAIIYIKKSLSPHKLTCQPNTSSHYIGITPQQKENKENHKT
jgi:hypothetical protein